jgi:GPI-anchor transamidase subunit T
MPNIILILVVVYVMTTAAGSLSVAERNSHTDRWNIQNEEFNERLTIRPHEDQTTLVQFDFDTTTHVLASSVSTQSSWRDFDIFPRALGEVLSSLGVSDMRLTLANGIWQASKWGACDQTHDMTVSSRTSAQAQQSHIPHRSLSRCAAAGAQLWTEFGMLDALAKQVTRGARDDVVRSKAEAWIQLQHALGGLFCSSLGSIGWNHTALLRCDHDPAACRSSGTNVRSTHHIRGHDMRKAFRFYGELAREAVCTENLTPWSKLLPCGAHKGIATLLDPLVLFDSAFQSISMETAVDCIVQSDTSKYVSRDLAKCLRLGKHPQTAHTTMLRYRLRLSVAAVMPSTSLNKHHTSRQPMQSNADSGTCAHGASRHSTTDVIPHHRIQLVRESTGAYHDRADKPLRACGLAQTSQVRIEFMPWFRRFAKRSGIPMYAIMKCMTGKKVLPTITSSSATFDLGAEATVDMHNFGFDWTRCDANLTAVEAARSADPCFETISRIISNRYIVGDDQRFGKLVVRVTNTHPHRTMAVHGSEILPSYLRVYFHSISASLSGDDGIETLAHIHFAGTPRTSSLSNSSPDVPRVTIYASHPGSLIRTTRHSLKPSLDPMMNIEELQLNATQIEWHTTIPAGCEIRLVIAFEKVFGTIVSFPPDVHRGSDIPAGLLRYRIIQNAPTGTWYRTVTNPLLVYLPSPDFSMPFNVIAFTSTALAFFFGSMFNVLFRSSTEIRNRDRASKLK